MFAVLELSDFAILTLLFLLFVSGSAYAVLRPSDAARLRRLELKVDLILRLLSIEYPDPTTPAGLSEEVRQLADDPARKIQAIKLHREQTGVGLKEAKDAVEAYMNRG
jgi:hypothetical protein